MFKSFFLSLKWALLAYGGAVMLLVLFYFQVETAWRFAEWMNILGDVVSGTAKYTPNKFLEKFVYEAVEIAWLFVIIQACINLVSNIFCWFWYEAASLYFLPNWNKTLQDVEGPAQRFQDSMDIFVRKFLGMFKAVARAALVLWTFVPKLWELSADFNFFYFSRVPGMLVWTVLLISMTGFLISFLVGIRLKDCNYNLQAAKALLRSGLEFVQRNKNRDNSVPHLAVLLKKTRWCSLRLFHNKFWLSMWEGSYGQLWAVLPIMFFGYNVFSGYVKYGLVAKTGSALGEVIGAMSTPIWLYDEFAEFMSVRQRIIELEETINNPDNWEEAKKELGWEDRRSNDYVFLVNGRNVPMTEEELAMILKRIKRHHDHDSVI